MFEKDLQLVELLDVYGALLGERPQQLLELYYNQDFSLGEIADEVGISRQGVRDSIKKAEKELHFFESKLHLAAKELAVRRAAERLLSLCEGQEELTKAVRELLDAADGV